MVFEDNRLIQYNADNILMGLPYEEYRIAKNQMEIYLKQTIFKTDKIK